MPVDLATLAIKVEVSGATRATSELNNLHTASRQAESGFRSAASGATAATNQMSMTFKGASKDISAMLMTMNTGFSGLPYALTRITGPIALLGVAAIGVMAGVGAAVKAGMAVIDDYQISVISIAASLTDMAKPGQGTTKELFERNAQYATEMYRKMTIEAAEHFATANQMMTVYNKLVQGGYAVRLDEIKALGILTDAIKIKTKGQDVERQLNTEIMALMQGQARAGSLLAQELKMRLGLGWAEIVAKTRLAGTFLELMTSLYPGIVAANEAIKNTISSQWNTLKGILSLIAIDGMQGIYQSIVDTLKDMNKYLGNHATIISEEIANAWRGVKLLVDDVYSAIKSIYAIVAAPVKWVIEVIGSGATFLSGQAQGGVYWAGKEGESFGIPGVKARQVEIPGSSSFGIGDAYGFGDVAKIPKPKLSTPRQMKELVYGSGGASTFFYGPGGELIPVYGMPGGAGPPPATEGRGLDKKKTGGDPTQGMLNRMQMMAKQMEASITKMEDGSFAAIDAVAAKEIEALEQVMGRKIKSHVDDLTLEQAYAYTKELIARKAADAKIKLEDDMWLDIAKKSGNHFAEIDDQYKKDAQKCGANEELKHQYYLIWANKTMERQIKNADAALGREKEYFSAQAGFAPLLEQQLDLQQKVLAVEEEQGKNKLKMMYLSYEINADEFIRLEALRAQTAEMAGQAEQRKRWQIEGVGGGISMAYVDSVNTAKTYAADQTAAFLKGLPASVSQTLASGFIGALQGKKPDLEALAWSMGEKMIQASIENFLVQLMPIALKELMILLGKEAVIKETEAQTAAAITITAAQTAGQTWLAYCIEASMYQQGGSGGGGSGLFGGLFGGGASPGMPGSPETLGFGGSILEEFAGVPFWHRGGIVKAHSGLKPDEILGVLQTGERVLSRSQNSEYERGGKSTIEQNIIINNNAPKTEAKTETTPSGDIIITIDQLTAAAYSRRGLLHRAINSGSGPVRR